ncbi:hypothetical protein BK133_00695 [Paenibacillus sp. FSL H8-0548]|uniref:hypothetical protein n=1 Tax=Paenibacillus sp. FSL H8-0548 TaxID=1920422 RepID=UPI00096EF2AC|nr:hypothetical protein [Paenibacillus sp. FSL H8-0548]OMF38758.1 hypothetical protein BK133_00695 [Paenibacillus sp. FSL H8-0548]
MMNTSRKRKNKKAVTAGAVLLAVMLAASACGNSSNTNNAAPGNDLQGTVDETPIVSQLPDESGVLEPDVSSPSPEPTTDNGGAAEEPAASVKVNEGTFSGLIDSHSIEVETAAGVIVLQVTDDQSGMVEALSDDAKIKFEYTEKAIEGDASIKQNWLVKIEEIK